MNEVTKPLLDVTGVNGNAYILLLRARRLLHRDEIPAFEAAVDADTIRRTFTPDLPEHFFTRLLQEVRKRCRVIE